MFTTFQQEGKPRRGCYGGRRANAWERVLVFEGCVREWRGRGGRVPSRCSLRSRIVSTGFYEVTEAEVCGTKMAGIKKKRVAEATGMSGVDWQGGTSLHLPTNFMRLVNSRKKLTDRLIHGLSNFII